jgi:O-antigen ligase
VTPQRRAAWLSLLFLLLAFLALLAMGALRRQRAFLTRGIPDSLPAQPIAHGGVRLGINVYLQEATDPLATLRAVRANGYNIAKQPFFYQSSEPYDWELSDRLYAAAEEAGVTLVPLLDGDPANDYAPPADPADFARWAGAFARRYGDQVHAYFIWDEPNLTSHWGLQDVNPRAYAALLSASAAAIRAADASAIVVAAPLAPTVETGPENLAEPLFLRELYEGGAASAFDVVAAKPYGFDSSPLDRTVSHDVLNFSRVILLRETMEAYGDGEKAIWAGNFGWNSLPEDWTGPPSIWGQVDYETQVDYTGEALDRARQEWPWIGLMFLENWEPAAPPDDPRWGFSHAGNTVLAGYTVAYPGFYFPYPNPYGWSESWLGEMPVQRYEGAWQFSPEYGGDVGASGDTAELTFWGTDAGLAVRRAGYQARFYVTVDGESANALPRDENGAALVLSAPDYDEDYVSLVPVATGLEPGPHLLQLVADGGAGQWPLRGYSVGYTPPVQGYLNAMVALGALAVLLLALAFHQGRRAGWGALGRLLGGWRTRLSRGSQAALTLVLALLVVLGGWMTWGGEAAGLYRRLGDGTQLALTAAAASLFYVTPWFFLYAAALALLFVLLFARPAWGLALVAFTIPFWVKPKAMLGYRFSPVEIFLLVALAAWVTRWLVDYARRQRATAGRPALPSWPALRARLVKADAAVALFVAVATISLLFTARLDVATNEWRTVIVEPALFYLLLRTVRLRQGEMWTVLDAFVLGAVAAALYGLVTYAGCLAYFTHPWCHSEQTPVIMAGATPRLRGHYGSPNNLALYLERVLPLLLATGLLLVQSRHERLPIARKRAAAYLIAAVPVTLALLLTFSKGALFLGVPAALVVLLLWWGQSSGRRIWPWLAGLAVAGLLLLGALLLIPPLRDRLNVQGVTSLVRLNVWRASVAMFADRPLFGVGLDNFLYEYRGRYIFAEAWREPHLNHPHNLVLDLATRLGFVGLVAGAWLWWVLGRQLWLTAQRVPPAWRPVAAGLGAGFVAMLAHGLVDHSFFLVDLSFVFYLFLGVAVWFGQTQDGEP